MSDKNIVNRAGSLFGDVKSGGTPFVYSQKPTTAWN
jgi:hypothetical protein